MVGKISQMFVGKDFSYNKFLIFVAGFLNSTGSKVYCHGSGSMHIRKLGFHLHILSPNARSFLSLHKKTEFYLFMEL